MSDVPSLDELWRSAPPAEGTFPTPRVAGLPEAARRYLEHAIAPGTRLASAVRLRMHGEIKLKRWLPFAAEQVIRWDRGMIWRATVRMHGVTIRGSDRLLAGAGARACGGGSGTRREPGPRSRSQASRCKSRSPPTVLAGSRV